MQPLTTQTCSKLTINTRPIPVQPSTIELLTTRAEVARYTGHAAAHGAPEPLVQGHSGPAPEAGPPRVVVHEVSVHCLSRAMVAGSDLISGLDALLDEDFLHVLLSPIAYSTMVVCDV